MLYNERKYRIIDLHQDDAYYNENSNRLIGAVGTATGIVNDYGTDALLGFVGCTFRFDNPRTVVEIPGEEPIKVDKVIFAYVKLKEIRPLWVEACEEIIDASIFWTGEDEENNPALKRAMMWARLALDEWRKGE